MLLSDLWEIGVEQVVHVDDRSEVDLDLRLLLSDLFESLHNVSKSVNVLCWLLDLELDLLDVIGQVLK